MFRRPALICCLLSFVLSQPVWATEFGYSVNINFGAGNDPVLGSAGIFDDRIWNNFAEPSQDQPVSIISDVFGQRSQSAANLRWNATSIQTADRVKSENPNDVRLMQGYLDSPASIRLSNVDQVVPDQRGPVTYTVILYAYGGRDGARGQYQVNRFQRDHIDTGEFDGTFTQGINGNTLVFKDLISPDLLIDTSGFGPVNAMSLVYCRPGDFNGDGTVDVSDLDELSQAFKSGSGQLKYDVNFDLKVDFNDVLSWIKCSKGTCVGDVNLDGVFDSSDLVQLFQQGAYESGDVATWTSGDWNGDCKFDSSDLLFAFQEGCYQADGALALAGVCAPSLLADTPQAVPEPAASWLIGPALLVAVRRGRKPRPINA
jgi:hypothetical protein